MGTPLNIKTTNKKIIYGNLETPKGKSKGLIIFVHGLTSSQDEPIIKHWSVYFTKKWYITYKFNLYGKEKNARKLETSCLKNHVDDINKVTTYFQKKWIKKIFLIWHSFGWLSILYANLSNIKWVTLWDASIWWKELLSDVTYDKKTKKMIIDRWDWVIYNIGSKMYKDFLIDSKKNLERMSKIRKPIKIICAEKWLQKAWKEYYKNSYYDVANTSKELSIIPWAWHCFFEKWTKEKLFEETNKRVKKYL